MKPWICLSSSSGETFKAVYSQLSKTTQDALIGFFVDRDCEAFEKAQTLLGAQKTYKFLKPQFETKLLEFLKAQNFSVKNNEVTIFLCGFFGILSSEFLNKCPGPIINTHPSLLPSFPGLDQKVHKVVFETVAISGFTVHLVTEKLDGGPIVYQHPVWIDPDLSWEQNRTKVREAEQKFLPQVLEQIVSSDLTSSSRNLSSREVRQKLPQIKSNFTNRSPI